MFRELTRKNKELPLEACLEILKNEKRGVLSVLGDDGYPYGMPMNHYFDPDDGCIYFHSGIGGHRQDALSACDKVSFCVYDQGFSEEGEWALKIKSVIVFGRMEILDRMDLIYDISRKLSHKFILDEEYITREIESFAHETLILRLIPEHICGKLVTES